MTTASIPITFTWTDDGVMRPMPRFSSVCDKEFCVGEHYQLEVVQQRSQQSHNHFFAALHEAWLQLPESVAKEFLNETKFRRWALIEAGYYDETMFQLASNQEARRFAGFCAGLDDYAEVIVSDEIVVVRKAKSQSKKAMGAKEFQRSKEAVLDVVSKLIGVAPITLQRNAGRAA